MKTETLPCYLIYMQSVHFVRNLDFQAKFTVLRTLLHCTVQVNSASKTQKETAVT